MKITTVDCDYVLPRFAASYLLVDGSGGDRRAVVIETGTARSVPRIIEALAEQGLGPESVDFVIVTHVHLDHAGGASELMKHCPNAILMAHPRAARHLKDPSKLIASAKQVYGAEAFEKLYGTIEPIEEGRIRSVEDGVELQWQGVRFKFLHTRGHANHHFSVLVSILAGAAIFTGDSFGVCYPDLQRDGLMIFPSTSPTDFDPEQARASVRRIAGSGAVVAYPTHFGPLRDIEGAAAQLIEELDFSEALLNEAVRSTEPDERLAKFCRDRIGARIPEVFARRGSQWDGNAARILGFDLDLNAQGIAYVAVKRRKGP